MLKVYHFAVRRCFALCFSINDASKLSGFKQKACLIFGDNGTVIDLTKTN
jgi:hypothetical protein